MCVFRSLAVTLCGMVLLAPATPLRAKQDAGVDFYAMVIEVREAPVGSPLPGLHLNAKVNGRVTDIYLAPVDFLDRYGMTFAKGDDVHVVGSLIKVGAADLVLAREIAVGVSNRRTLYLRDDKGPLW